MTTPTTPRWLRCFQLHTWLGLFCVAHLLSGQTLAQTDPDVETIVVAWNQHLSTLGCVKYVVEGTEFFPKDSIEPGFPAEDFSAPRKMTLWIDFERNRFRKELSWHQADLSLGLLRSTYAIQTWDGLAGWTSKPRHRNTERYQGESKYVSNLVKHPPDDVFLELTDRTILLAEQFVRPWTTSVETLREPLATNSLRVHGWAELKDSKCLVLRPSSSSRQDTEELWIDVERGFSIVRYARIRNGTERDRLNMSYRSEGPKSVLDRFEHIRFGTVVCSMHVASRELIEEPEPELFALAPETGDVVRDVGAGERYLLDGSQKLDIRQVYLRDQQAKDRRRWLLWGTGASLTGLAIFAARFFFFGRRSTRT